MTDFIDTGFLKTDEIFLRVNRLTKADPEKGFVPAYHFEICLLDGTEVGNCDIRIGHNENTYFGGNIGYRVYEDYRGHSYAYKACCLLFELARRHSMEYLLITCRPDNIPSRKTLEKLDGELIEIADVPEKNDMRVNEGIEKVCVFKYYL